MKTYPYTHPTAVISQQPSILRKSIFLLFSTLIAFAAFANSSVDTGRGPVPDGYYGSNDAEFTLPLVLKNFNAIVNNRNVSLTWITGHEKDLSHFVVQRSTNGVDYVDAGIVFSLGNSTAVQTYDYVDPLNITSAGVIYYRLKMMDTRRRYQYSPVRLVRLSETSADMKVQAYPNPVMNELRITIPEKWQNKQVSYELYNVNGNMVKRVVTENASQTETMSVMGLNAGSYVMKAYTQDEFAAERIVKK